MFSSSVCSSFSCDSLHTWKNQRATNQHEWFSACFSDLNGFVLGTPIEKRVTLLLVALPSVSVRPHPSDLDVVADERFVMAYSRSHVFCVCVFLWFLQCSVSLRVKRSLMFPRRWRCSHLRRSRPRHRRWRSSSSRASGTYSSRSNTCSASDRYVLEHTQIMYHSKFGVVRMDNIFERSLVCSPMRHLLDKNTVKLWNIIVI